MTTESPVTVEQERNTLEIGTPAGLKEKDLFINNPERLQQARDLHRIIWKKNMGLLNKSIMLTDVEATGNKDKSEMLQAETPKFLDAESLGRYTRTKQNFYTAEYTTDSLFAPVLHLDLGSQIGSQKGQIKATKEETRYHYNRECRLKFIHNQRVDKLDIERKILFIDNELATDKRRITIPLTSQHGEIMAKYQGEGEIVISATKWFHEAEKYKDPKYNWMRKDKWDVDVRVQGGQGTYSLVNLNINKDKKAITVMPISDITEPGKRYYPNVDLVRQVLPQIPTIVPLEGEYSILKGEFSNEPPPNQEISYPKVEFKER